MLDTVTIERPYFEPSVSWSKVYMSDDEDIQLLALTEELDEVRRQDSTGVLLAFEKTKRIFIPYWFGEDSEKQGRVLNLGEARFVITENDSNAEEDFKTDPQNRMSDDIRKKIIDKMELVPFIPKRPKGLTGLYISAARTAG